MATLVLGTVGRLVGGPIGGIIGATLGGVIDNSIFGGGAPRGGRLSNLAVQSAAYGEPIAVITGRMRAAGNLLWSSGIKESTGGGGKGQGSTYSYASSFAVGLAGRTIAGVGRIWADGRLIRDAAGSFLSPVVMRVYNGDERQAVDPLIAAVEGSAGAPAYRGIAYAVFEDLPLADYGNRIPNLTFEVIADAGNEHDAGTAIAALAVAEGRAVAAIEGSFPAISGHFAGQSGSIAGVLAPLLDMSGAAVAAHGGLIVRGGGGASTLLPADDCDARLPGAARSRERRRLLGGETRIGGVEVSFYDVARDFQPGLQRARRDAGGAVDQRSIASALTAAAAKTLATDILARAEAARWQLGVRLPWRHLGIRPGDHVRIAAEPGTWRVRRTRFESLVVHLELERVDAGVPVVAASDSGRALTFDDRPAGETSLLVLDLPPLPGDLPTTPRLWIAAAGASPGWRRAPVDASADLGVSYARIGTVAAATPMGSALTVLPAGPADVWDRFSAVDVALLADAMWLESRPEASVLAGANLALIGDEIIQFSHAELVAPQRFRLSGLLRGRSGTEFAIGRHAAGDRFVLLDRAAMLPFDPPVDALGRVLGFRAAGSGDAAAVLVVVTVGGAALRPLSPAHLRLEASGGDVVARWVRRSRAGFGWPDFVDAPLAETGEFYRVEASLDGRLVRVASVESPRFVYTAVDRAADGGGSVLGIAVAQLSALAGPGVTATGSIGFGT